MRRLLYISFAITIFMAVVSCGPTRHAIHVEMRHPSKSGMELAGKIVSVLYAATGETDADMYNETMASSFASTLEKDYGTGDGSIGTYKVDAATSDYANKDSLMRMLVKTGADLVILFGPISIQPNVSGSIPLKVNLYCYDGMNKEDRVYIFSGSTVLSSLHKDSIDTEASHAGKVLAQSFISQWKHEQYSIAYYDGQKWYEALALAEQYDWKSAMDIWISLLDSNDILKRASAEYNIAVACFMLGDMELADLWLEKSKADNDMPTLTDALRKRIDARK
jgi:tetratricopeptide (TPR) repeat protein